MNAGIADAMNLSWILAGVLQGWAEPAILDAHEAERWPITEQVSRYAMNTAASLARARAEVPASIEDEGPEGDAARERFGRTVYELNVPQYCCGGLNFGYFYDRSPIIAHDGEAAPPYSMYDFTPSTVPGCRTPHLWLRDGRSLYDAMGIGFTLLRSIARRPWTHWSVPLRSATCHSPFWIWKRHRPTRTSSSCHGPIST